MRTHINRVNQIDILRGVRKIFIPENNLGNEGQTLWNMIKKMPDVRCYWQKDDRPGVYKGKDTAEIYQYTFNNKLSNNRVHFAAEFFTTSRDKTREQILGLAREQLEQFQFVYDPKTNKQTITGKHCGNDDLAVALLMGPVWGRQVMKDPRKLVN